MGMGWVSLQIAMQHCIRDTTVFVIIISAANSEGHSGSFYLIFRVFHMTIQ